jgi:hypothetical protein
MKRLFWGTAVLTLALVDCAAAESIYLTTSERIEKYGIGSPYTFIAPYVIDVRTAFSLSITKVSTSSDGGKAAAPSITHAAFYDDQDGARIVYAVSCDLSSVLHPENEDYFTVDAKPPEFGGTNVVVRVGTAPNTVTVRPAKKPSSPFKSGTVTGTTCQPADVGTFSVTFSVTAIPTRRAYLYLVRNALFSDSIDVSVDSNNLLSKSDSSSVQQITNILTELGQTIGLLMTRGASAPGAAPGAGTPAAPSNPREKCFIAIGTQLKRGPFYATPSVADIREIRKGRRWTVHFDRDIDQDVTLTFELHRVGNSSGFARLTNARIVEANGRQKEIFWQNGLVAFFPTPAVAISRCNVVMPDGTTHYFDLSAPTMVNIYGESQFLDPQRDFLTGPQDTLTFSAGFITGHKYTGQSPAKTIVDTVTAPIRAMIPSVQTQQNTQVVTGGGKPDQTTTSTTTTTNAPKPP